MSLRAVDNAATPPASGGLPGEIPAGEVGHALLRRGLALWNDLRGPRRFPSRSQISPRVLGALLRHTVLVKVLDDGGEFEVRIVGDAIAAVQDVPLQGLTTSGIDRKLPGYGTLLRQFYMRGCNAKAPMALRGPIQRRTLSRTLHRELLLLPLGDDDAAVDHLLSLVVYLPPQRAA